MLRIYLHTMQKMAIINQSNQILFRSDKISVSPILERKVSRSVKCSNLSLVLIENKVLSTPNFTIIVQLNN